MNISPLEALAGVFGLMLICLFILTTVHYELLRRRRPKNDWRVRGIKVSRGEALYCYIVERFLHGCEYCIYRLNEAPWTQARKSSRKR